MFESGLRHHIVCKLSRSRAAFFVPGIQYLPIIPAILTLSRRTNFNVHLPTDDGISVSKMLVPRGRG